MARRRKKQTLQDMIIEFLVKATFGCVFIVVVNYMFLKKYAGMMIGGTWLNPLLIVLIFIMAVGLGIYLANIKLKLEKANIKEIDKMSGTMFERYLEQFFKRQGWQVKRTGGQGDYGADLILTITNRKVVVQAKRWQKNVGYEAIQQAHTSKDVYKASEAWVITNSGFTEQAMDGAKRLGIKLWDREFLIEQMAKVNASGTIKLPPIDAGSNKEYKEVAAAIEDRYVCTTCGKPMTQRAKEYCLANPQRFNNRMYCYEHQRA